MTAALAGLRATEADEHLRNVPDCMKRGSRLRSHLSGFFARVEGGPGSVGSTHRSLTHRIDFSDRRASHAGYPDPTHPASGFHPVSGDQTTRRPCPSDIQRSILRRQGYVCVYCAEPFGSVVRRTKLSVTQVHYDHAIPFAYLNCNPRWNWVAACNVCNQIKGSKMFRSIQEIRMHVLEIREKRRHHLVWVAPVSSELNPEQWAVAFASFLTSLSFRDARQIEKDLPSPLGAALSRVENLTKASAIVKPPPRDVDLGGYIVYGGLNRGLWPWSK